MYAYTLLCCSTCLQVYYRKLSYTKCVAWLNRYIAIYGRRMFRVRQLIVLPSERCMYIWGSLSATKALQEMSDIRLSLRPLTYPKLKSVGFHIALTARDLHYIILFTWTFFLPTRGVLWKRHFQSLLCHLAAILSANIAFEINNLIIMFACRCRCRNFATNVNFHIVHMSHICNEVAITLKHSTCGGTIYGMSIHDSTSVGNTYK